MLFQTYIYNGARGHESVYLPENGRRVIAVIRIRGFRGSAKTFAFLYGDINSVYISIRGNIQPIFRYIGGSDGLFERSSGAKHRQPAFGP
jgi:hypothetical protein